MSNSRFICEVFISPQAFRIFRNRFRPALAVKIITRNFGAESNRPYNDERWLNLPNSITLGRIAFTPIISFAIMYDYKEIAVGGLALAIFSDWLDGYIARNYGQSVSLSYILGAIPRIYQQYFRQ